MVTKQSLIANLKQQLEPLDYVYALWLEGSDANGTADAYSDIDLWADVADEKEQEAIASVESALRGIAPFDFCHIMTHGHPKIRQRIYHLAGMDPYLMIDFCWQLHSRPRNSYSFDPDDTIETARVIFDKDDVIRFCPRDPLSFAAANQALMSDMTYRMAQHIRVVKYVKRGLFPEAFAAYGQYVLEPLVALLRVIHTPAHTDYGLLHISNHLPQDLAARLAFFVKVGSLSEIEDKTAWAKTWFDELKAIIDRTET